MDDRIKFVARVLDGEQMSDLCRGFGISRRTRYKIYIRYKACGLEALSDRSKRPVKFGNQLPMQVEKTILSIKEEKPDWEAAKAGVPFFHVSYRFGEPIGNPLAFANVDELTTYFSKLAQS